MASHLKIRTHKTGHFYQHGTWSPTTQYVWICLHGYGQLARHFIKRFEFLDPERHVVIAPEGLNRFYFEGVNDRPVASWMTREDRLDEIADFILFLDGLRQKLAWDKNKGVKVIYFGFSQGVTALFRWLVDRTPRADYLLCWAGSIPEDVLYDFHHAYFKPIACHYFLGDADEYIPVERVEKGRTALLKHQINFQLHVYPGTHKVEQSILMKWVGKHLNS